MSRLWTMDYMCRTGKLTYLVPGTGTVSALCNQCSISVISLVLPTGIPVDIRCQNHSTWVIFTVYCATKCSGRRLNCGHTNATRFTLQKLQKRGKAGENATMVQPWKRSLHACKRYDR